MNGYDKALFALIALEQALEEISNTNKAGYRALSEHLAYKADTGYMFRNEGVPPRLGPRGLLCSMRIFIEGMKEGRK